MKGKAIATGTIIVLLVAAGCSNSESPSVESQPSPSAAAASPLAGVPPRASGETKKCYVARLGVANLDQMEAHYFLAPVLIDAEMAAQVPEVAAFRGQVLDGSPSETVDGSDPDDIFWTGNAATIRNYLREHC